MRSTTRTILLLTFLALVALLASGCAGGPDDADAELTAACERQIKEIEDEAHEGSTKTAKSTELAMEQQELVECAGQPPFANAAAEESEAEEGDAAEGDAEAGETTPVVLDPAARELFAAKCGVCHTLADAETTGAVGPNLDETDMDAEAIAAQIENGGSGMPANVVEGDDVQTVADYVAAAAAADA